MRRASSIAAVAGAWALAACGTFLGVGADEAAAPPDPDAGAAQPDGAPADGPPDVDAECSAEPCGAPELVGNAGGAVRRIAVGPEGVYAIAQLPGGTEIVRVQKGAPAERLDPNPSVADAPGFDTDIALHASGVYWGTPNGLRKRARGADAGAAASMDPSLGAPVSGVRVEGDTLHFTVTNFSTVPSPNQGRVKACTLPACADVSGPFADLPLDVALPAQHPYWFAFASASDHVYVLFDASGAIGGTQSTPGRFAYDAARAVWSTSDGVRTIAPPSRTIEDVLPTSSSTRVEGIAIDDGGALWLAHQRAVERCVVDAGRCTPGFSLPTQAVVLDVAAFGEFVYWGEGDGSIRRLRRP